MDVEFEDNVKIVIATHKANGLMVLLRLWQKIYREQGYFTDWKKKNAILFADSINMEPDSLNAIIETCFEEEIFHRGIFNKHGILTSSGIQKRWLRIVTDLKRKDCKVDPEYDVLLFIPVETPIIPGETRVSSRGNATKERKGKERKREERKGKNLGAGAPDEKTPEQIEWGKIWAKMVDVWFVFYESKFNEKPSFAGRDPATLKTLINLIKKKVLAAPGFPWTDQSCGSHFQRFLQLAYLDDWLKNNFLLQNLVSQFDKIIAYGKNGTGPGGKPPTGASVDTVSAFSKIDRVFGSAGTAGN